MERTRLKDKRAFSYCAQIVSHPKKRLGLCIGSLLEASPITFLLPWVSKYQGEAVGPKPEAFLNPYITVHIHNDASFIRSFFSSSM